MLNLTCDVCKKEAYAKEGWFRLIVGRANHYSFDEELLTIKSVDDSVKLCNAGYEEAHVCSMKCAGKITPTLLKTANTAKASFYKKKQDEEAAKKKAAAEYEASVKAKEIELEAKRRLKKKNK